ncbi:hypothetical protein RhiirA1_469757 [Rhizophagus irregularis]|uniref:Uncharacterized protein n=1 Tax=Rhizophagus irregularis TaxID=588596 RepID=A0A2N0R7F5_9GLOM|nr:hypothetical protein RhiirA1_469757 [Rhizophagus irregularis]
MSNEELTKEQLFIKPYLLGYYRSFVGLELEYLRDFYKAEEKKEHISLAEYENAWKERHNKLEESVKVLKEEKKFADEQIISLEKEKKIADKSLEKNIKKALEQIISLENGVRKFKDLEKNKSKTKSHDW